MSLAVARAHASAQAADRYWYGTDTTGPCYLPPPDPDRDRCHGMLSMRVPFCQFSWPGPLVIVLLTPTTHCAAQHADRRRVVPPARGMPPRRLCRGISRNCNYTYTCKYFQLAAAGARQRSNKVQTSKKALVETARLRNPLNTLQY